MTIDIQVSARHRQMVMPHRPDVANLIPHARRFNDESGRDLLALPHGREEVRLLRNLGIHAPAPVLWQYDWCGDTPFDTQRETTALLTTNTRAYVLSEMGTGKTRATLHALNFLMGQGEVRKALIVAPLSTLTTVWQEEIYTYFPGRTACVLYGTRAKRLKLLRNADADFYIINHDGMGIIADVILGMPELNALVLDELAVYRSPKAQRSKNMRKIARKFKYVWGLTGSPTPNAPTDAWAQAKIVTPTRAPEYFTAFKRSAMFQVSNFIWVPRREAKDLVANMLKPCVRFTRDETVELPPVVVQDRMVALSTAQASVYNTMMTHCSLAFGAHTVNAANEGVLMSKLLQIAAGAVYSDKGTIYIDNQPRLQALTDIIEEAGHKVLVFVPFVHALKAVADHVAKKHVVATVYGETSKTERDDIFTAFQNTPDPHVIVAHPGTMSHGLTLTAANCITWFSPTASLDTYEQANARISRPGQKHKQLIVNMWGSRVEQRVYTRLKNKAAVQGVLLELLEGVDEGTQ